MRIAFYKSCSTLFRPCGTPGGTHFLRRYEAKPRFGAKPIQLQVSFIILTDVLTWYLLAWYRLHLWFLEKFVLNQAWGDRQFSHHRPEHRPVWSQEGLWKERPMPLPVTICITTDGFVSQTATGSQILSSWPVLSPFKILSTSALRWV